MSGSATGTGGASAEPTATGATETRDSSTEPTSDERTIRVIS